MPDHVRMSMHASLRYSVASLLIANLFLSAVLMTNLLLA
jgi:hypothetical protein